MEPRHDEPANQSVNVPGPTPEKKERKGCFQIVKLEERIAPKIGGGGHHHTGDLCRDSFRCY